MVKEALQGWIKVYGRVKPLLCKNKNAPGLTGAWIDGRGVGRQTLGKAASRT